MMVAMVTQAPVLVLNGKLEWNTELVRIARQANPLFAADGGANALARLGLRPESVIGDLDSISSSVRAWLGDERLVYRQDQEHTDFEKALEFVFNERHLPRLTVLAAMGNRFDHTVCNLGILARHARGPNLVLRSVHQQVLATSNAIELAARPGETWSFWSFGSDTRLSVAGVRWPIRDHRIGVDINPSISNQATGTMLRIEPHGGTVVACRQLACP